MKAKALVAVFAIMVAVGVGSTASAAEVVVGALNDMTGATSDVGKDYALGIAEAVNYCNDNGGINGKPIKLIQFDYGYRVPEALTKYKLFKRMGAVAVHGWAPGTPRRWRRP
jgi:branched-chain amino acid transport system substrate-binding protein